MRIYLAAGFRRSVCKGYRYSRSLSMMPDCHGKVIDEPSGISPETRTRHPPYQARPLPPQEPQRGPVYPLWR